MPKPKLAGLLFIAFPLVLQVPFTLLSMHYHYPDILREPAAVILENFQAGGKGLLAMWYAYALSLLIFMAALLRYDQLSRRAQWIGLFSAIVQFIALLRWTFLVPFLSAYHANAQTAEARQLIEVMFTLQHNFLGVGLGEHVGLLSLAIWTLVMVKEHASFGPVFRWFGINAALVLILGLVEHLAVAFGFPAGILAHGALVGFVLWSIWLIILGVKLIKILHQPVKS